MGGMGTGWIKVFHACFLDFWIFRLSGFEILPFDGGLMGWLGRVVDI